MAKKIEANRIKVDKDPSGNKVEHLDIGQCPRSYSYFILFAFRKMYEQKRLVKFMSPKASSENVGSVTICSQTCSRNQQRKKEVKHQRALKSASFEQDKIQAFTEHSSKKLKLAHEKNRKDWFDSRMRLAVMAKDAGDPLGATMLHQLVNSEMKAMKQEIIVIDNSNSNDCSDEEQKTPGPHQNINFDCDVSEDDDHDIYT